MYVYIYIYIHAYIYIYMHIYIYAGGPFGEVENIDRSKLWVEALGEQRNVHIIKISIFIIVKLLMYIYTNIYV